jgi:hypothetical protein
MTRTEIAKLTNELENLNQPVPDWSTVDELAAVAYEIPNPKPESAPIRLDYGQCVDLYKALDKEIKERQARMDDLKLVLQAALMVSGQKKVKAGDHFCQMIEKAGSRKIVAEKLLAKGVSAQVIAESTEVGKGSTYLQIRSAGEGK